MNNYNWLLSRLDAFIRKYYANQLLRGGLILLSCILFYVLTVSVSEYYLYLPVWLRTTLFFSFIGLGSAAILFWIILPLMKMARLGKTISREQAAVIVGKHFPEISDKLLNILQLHDGHDASASRELIEASIDQKAKQLSVVPITRAVDLTRNRRYLRFLLPLLLIGVFILVAAPNVFKDASERLLQPTKEFERPAPFQFVIKNESLVAVRNADFSLDMEVKGNALPAEVFLVLNDDRIPMAALGSHQFQYMFRNVTEKTTFRFFANGFYSHPFTLNVAQKPVLKAFKISIDYPDYTGRKDEVRNSLGDLNIPVGTQVSYALMADYTDNATFTWASGASEQLLKNDKMFGFIHRFMSDTAYTISLHNRQTTMADEYRYHVSVIPDEYPSIQLQQFRDSVSGKQILLTGTAGDDYGIQRVLFHYTILNERNEVVSNKAVTLPSSGGTLAPFQYYFDIQSANLLPGQKLNYFIEAWDNDGVHGSKAARSELMSYQMFTPQQLDSAMDRNSAQISSGLSNSQQQTQRMQDQIQDMQNQMLQSDNMSWEDKQNLQSMQQQQLELKNRLEAAQKRFEEQIQQSQQKQYSDDVHEKQQELKDQMDNLLNKELAEQMKKLQELMDQLNKQNAMQTMQQLQEDNKLFNMDLERMKELIQQLEMQMRMEDLANQMDSLAKKQGDLKDQTLNGNKDNKSLQQQQQDLKNQLDSAMSGAMKEINQLNDSSSRPQNMDPVEQKGQDAAQQMQQSQQQLGNNNKSGAGKNQSQAQQNLQDMAAQLRAQASGMDIEQINKDISAVRQILTNLMRLSFDQESLMASVHATSPSSPQFLLNQSEQGRLHANSQMIRDSLFELSKNMARMSAQVNKETSELESNMRHATQSLEGRFTGDALTRQQYVMTHANNLALMLNEALSNLMQMQSQAMKPGSGSCNKPGGANPKPGNGSGSGMQLSDIITQQQQLGNSMGQMGQGKKPGGQKPGGQSGQGQSGQGNGQGNGSSSDGNSEYGDAEQLARLANQQAAIRRQLQALQSQLNSQGMGNAKELREIQEQMDKNETDLVNRNFSLEFINRQKDILTHLLQAEKSLREQEQDDKRTSKSGDNTGRPIPPELQQYLQDRQKMMQLYRTVPPSLKPYYRSMVEQYYRMINTQ